MRSSGRGFGVAVLVATFTVFAAGACSDGDGSGGGSGASGGASGNAGSSGTTAGSAGSSGSADGGPLGDYLDRTAAAYCEAIFACAELRKDTVIEVLGGRERCPAVLKRILQSDPRNRERARLRAQGSLTIQNDALEACLAHQRSCVLSEGDIFQPCREVLDGSVPRGESCQFDDECAGDAYCMAAAGASCPGTCQARKPAGSECRTNGECAGRYSRCDFDATTGRDECRELTVVEGVAPGAPCNEAGTSELSICRPELWCGDAAAGQQVCRELIAPGGACESDFDVCAKGHFCARDLPPGSCQPVSLARDGEPCSNASLVFCDVYAGSFCVADSCQNTGDGAVGTRCGVDTLNCDLGLFCDRTSDTCQPESAAGGTCNSDRQCSSGSCGTDSRCAATYCGL